MTPYNNDVSGSRVFILTEGDAYTGASAGFYKQATVYGEAISPGAYYTCSESPYSMYLVFAPSGGASVTTNKLTWYVDQLSSLPAVISCGITSVSSDLVYITGVPTLTASASFGFQATLSNLVYRFLRSDRKHFTAQVQTSSGSSISTTLTVGQQNIDGSTHAYYSAPTQLYSVSTTKHNTDGQVLSVNPGSIQFSDFSIQLSYASSIFDEALRLRVVASNLQGDSSQSVVSGWVSPEDGSVKPVRIDTSSVSSLSGITPYLVNCGQGQFPESDYGSTFDHTQSISGTDQLQLVSGRWWSFAGGVGYKNYSGFYLPGQVVLPDYSSLTSSDGFRYVCYKYAALKASGTFDTVTITFSSTGLTLAPSSDDANFRLYVKVVSSDTSTVWASGTAAINPSGWSAITKNGQGCMDNANASVGSIRVFVPTGTVSTSSVYVRFGLRNDVSQSIYNISCTAN